MTTYTRVVTAEGSVLTQVKAPVLPVAPVEYQQRYGDDLNNVLRLYFNQVNAFLSQLRLEALNTLALPQGAFFQDGVTTTTNTISNSATVIPVADTSKFQDSGVILIESEFIIYTSKTSTQFNVQTTPSSGRGAYGSSAAAHNTIGTYVTEGQAATAPAALFMSETSSSNGVSLDSGDKSKIRFTTAGYYNIQFSLQLMSFRNAVDNVTLWFSKNGTAIPYSAGVGTIPARISATKPATAIISWNIIVDVNANDYIQLYFFSESGETLAVTYSPGTPAGSPISPSVILTATFTSAL